MKRIIISIVCLVWCFGMTAQNGIDGVVCDTEGKPMKGIKIRLNGLIKAEKTSSKGNFRIKKVIEGDTLLVYPSENLVARIPIRSGAFLSLQLCKEFLRCKHEDNWVSYMYQPAPKVSYSSNVITYRQIQEYAPNSLVELLRGKIAGLQIQEVEGESKASIRGVSSMSLNTEPLFIIGGSQYETLEAANNAVAVEDIREVEVKKDGSEFGMKGANGVIIVRTK